MEGLPDPSRDRGGAMSDYIDAREGWRETAREEAVRAEAEQPVSEIKVTSRHLEDYVLFNTSDGTRWRPHRRSENDIYTWTRAD